MATTSHVYAQQSSQAALTFDLLPYLSQTSHHPVADVEVGLLPVPVVLHLLGRADQRLCSTLDGIACGLHTPNIGINTPRLKTSKRS